MLSRFCVKRMFPHENRAIIFSDRGDIKNSLNYGEVYQISDVISDFISAHISEEHQCLGLKMSHNIYIPSIVLSLQKLQHSFMFLNGSSPEPIIQELGIAWVLSFDITETCVATLDLKNEQLFLQKYAGVCIKSYKDIFYIIATSGTTGDCKFVQVGAYSIQSNINSLSKIFNIQSNDVIYFGTPLTFDPSMIELLLALHNGACLLITTHANPNYLHETLFNPHNGVTVIQMVPSLFLRWSQKQIKDLLKTRLRILAFGGENFPKMVLQYEKSKELRIFNLYGITELSCWASIYETSLNDESVPLGQALDDTIVEVRDDLGTKVVEGEGEIFIGSTKRRCVVNNEGEHDFRATGDIAVVNHKGIFYEGRKNDTFKRFGHKIHLSKIEEMIQEKTQLRNKCVWSKNESKLLLFLIIEDYDVGAKDKIVDKFRVKLLHSLPKECFPDFIDIIRKCPVTSHGKTDQKTLESIYLNRNPANQSSVIKSLITKCLGLEENFTEFEKKTFFELGGNSVLAIQLLTEFKEQTGVECPDLVTALFEKDIQACIESVSGVKPARKRLQSGQIGHETKKTKPSIDLKIAWTYDLQACVDSAPLVFCRGDQVFVAVGSFSHLFVVLDATNGKEVAKFLLPDVIEASPSLSQCKNFLYVGCFDGCLYCLDFNDNSINWVYRTRDRIKCTPVACRDLTSLVFGSYDKHVHCVNAKSGSPIWKTCVSESTTATPYARQGKIYIATICGTCLCLLETTGEILWKYKTSSPIFGAPCAINDIIAWPEVQGKLLFLTCEGCKVEEFDCNGHVYSSLVAYKNMIMFGCNNQCLYVLTVDKGAQIRAVVNLGENLTTPCVCKDRIIVSGNSGSLFMIDFNGRLMAELRLPKEVFSSVRAYEGRLFVGCRDNNLYCIEIEE